MYRYRNQVYAYIPYDFPSKIMFEQSHNFISFESQETNQFTLTVQEGEPFVIQQLAFCFLGGF